MKKLVFAFLSAAISFTSMANNHIVKFIELKSYELVDALPPTLTAHFDVACNQSFLQVIRHEVNDPQGKAIISLGGLIEETDVNCDRSKIQEVAVDAGHSYSGRDWEVRSILLGN